jgi:hypothetical protein
MSLRRAYGHFAYSRVGWKSFEFDALMAGTHKHKAATYPCTVVLVGCVFVLAAQSLLLIGNESIVSLKMNLIMQLILVVLFGAWTYLESGKYLNAPIIFIGAIYVWHSPFLTGHYFELANIFEWTGRHLTYGEEYVRATGFVALSGVGSGRNSTGTTGSRGGEPRERSAICLQACRHPSSLVRNDCYGSHLSVMDF